MPDVERSIRTMVDAPLFPPEQIHELEWRVARRRRRRRVLRTGTVSLLVLAVAASVPFLLDGDEEATSLRTGPASEGPALEDPAPPIPEDPGPPTSGVYVTLPQGWQTLYAAGELLVVGTHPLQERDLVLALLAREDAVFTDFPSEGVVFVVGSDGTRAKYVADPSRKTRTTIPGGGGEVVTAGPDAMVGPGPPLALGPATTLPGGVTVRRGDVPNSSVVLAAYAGPNAPPAAAQEAEAIAASVRLPQPDSVPGPPPPAGSRPGFDKGGVSLDASRQQHVGSVDAPGVTYAVHADGGCATVTSSRSQEPIAGGCHAAPVDGTPVVVARAMDLYPPFAPPGQSFPPGPTPWGETMVVLLRVGSDVQRVSAALVDGRTVDATIGGDGWAILATDGRAFLIEGIDGNGDTSRVPVY